MSGDISTDDFDLWKYAYAESFPASWHNGDFNYSSTIDTNDFDLWKYRYSFSYPALPGVTRDDHPESQRRDAVGLSGRPTKTS